jgi:hypothetical protein
VAYVAPDIPLNDSKPIRPHRPTEPTCPGPNLAKLRRGRPLLRNPHHGPGVSLCIVARAIAGALAAGVVLGLLPGRLTAGSDLLGIEVTEVHEAEHSLSVRIDGLVATVESRQVIVNQGARDTEVFYSFDLPVDAAVVGAEVHLPDGRRGVSSAVDSRTGFRFVADETSAGSPDMGLLRVVDQPGNADEQRARYELRLYPVPAGKSAVAKIRWLAPLRYRDGRLELRIPGRGSAPNRIRERIDVTWNAPSGSRGLREVRSGGVLAAGSASAPVRSARLRLDAPTDSDLVLEARPVFRAGQPLIVEVATAPADKRRGAYALTVLAPATTGAASSGYERVVLVVDVSRSLGPTGLAAAKSLADALLAAAPPAARLEAIVFDRKARRMMGGLSDDRTAVRKRLSAALAPARAENGSDLGDALSEVASLLRKAGSTSTTPLGNIARGTADSTLIVIFTDGVLPLDLDEVQAVSRIGNIALNEAHVSSVVIVPDPAPLPDVSTGALGELARRTGGRVLAIRHGEAGARAAGLWTEISRPAPVSAIEVDWRGATVTGQANLPDQLESGEGRIVFGWYHGARPPAPSVRGEMGGRPFAARARRASTAASRAAMPLTTVSRPADEVLPTVKGVKREDKEAERDAFVAAAHRAGVATRHTSLVVLDSKDGFARDRLAFARKWGTSQYRRFPPPAERALGEVKAPDARPTIGRSAPTNPRRTGELDQRLIERLMKHHVVPRARACYDRALRRDANLSGAITIELEMIRGEVQDARIARTNITDSAMTACLLDAAFATPVPQVALGDTSEVVVVARYPLRFKKTRTSSDVSAGSDPGAPTDPNDPLGGIDP